MNVHVIGAGSWGLALARVLANNGNAVRLWCRDEDDPGHLRTTRESRFFLKGVKLPESVEVDTSREVTADLAVLAVPSHAMRTVAQSFRFPPGAVLVSVAKGIENETLLCMHEVLSEVAGGSVITALSGPSHAEEVARDLPASVVLAGEIEGACKLAQRAFMGETFRVYTSGDLVGVELGGALKNVIAVAAGVCDGLGLGDNAKAALITRGLAEMARIGTAMGADPLTFAGLSGMGDLIVTCESKHSRNRALGEAIAGGQTLDDYMASTRMVAEGVRTCRSALALAKTKGIELPIAEQVHRVLFENADPREAVTRLMQRDAKPEQG